MKSVPLGLCLMVALMSALVMAGGVRAFDAE
jgi:hypothetical protein